VQKQDNAHLREILGQTADLPRERRDAFLETACAGDEKLRGEVESLLASLDNADGFLDEPTLAAGGLSSRFFQGDGPQMGRAGERIGRYKLLQLIGEGGFGSVFMAEQQTPVVRKVALKIIKPGMDSASIIARFEAERQALAIMDHPNIARVLDAGTTDAGRPYFVMELVQGIPINQYCDRKRLTPRQRIELFVPVCRAVQHAHQKGIIHRDLKPSNVLVMNCDGQPVPKVIDFGVAKALNQRLTEKTLFTQFGHAVGTPEYMSPEQAEMDVVGADTRSDIYSLGALLYELLTGVTPLDRAKLREAGYAQMLKMIREEEPVKPSTRLTHSGDALAAISTARGTDSRELRRLTAGDLDWIVMKCLEKDRARRFETADGLARDLERYLRDEPVEASPPSRIYRLRKLTSKHRKEAVALIAIVAALVLGVIGTSIGLARARINLAAAKASEQHAQQVAREMEIEKEIAATNEKTARDALFEHAYWEPREYVFMRVGAVTSISGQLDRPRASDQRRTGLLFERARNYMCLGRSAEAKSDLVALTRAARADSEALLFAGSALAYLGQLEEYRETCQVMIGQFGSSNNWVDLERTIETSLLIPNGAGLEARQALAWIDRLPDNKRMEPWVRFARALALYRAGDSPGCIESARGVSGPHVTCGLTAQLVEGMAYSRLGRPAEASAAYAHAQEQFDGQFDGADPLLALLVHGQDENWLNYQTLRREAQPNSQDALPDADGLLTRASFFIELERINWASTDLNQTIDVASRLIRSKEATAQAAPLLATRAECFARMGNFKQAVADYQRAVEMAPEKYAYWHNGFVPLLLQVGDAEGYRRWRSQELRRFQSLTGHAAYHVAKDAFMLPLDGEDLKIAVELADNGFKDGDTDCLCAAYQTKGLAEYRSGHFREAISALLKSLELTHEPKLVPIDEFLLAMSYERDNDHQAAQAAFARGVNAISDIPKGDESCIGVSPPMDWVLARLLRREAQGLIQSK